MPAVLRKTFLPQQIISPSKIKKNEYSKLMYSNEVVKCVSPEK
jgi:hypothetical protein